MRSTVLAGLAWICLCAPAHAADTQPEACSANADWAEPARPLKIHGNTWFVGTCGLSSILITSAAGHVLIDGGVEAAAPLIEANIRRLGFRVEDVRYIVSSHEHYDHVGGIARLQRDSRATVLAREPAALALENGHNDRADPQFLIAKPFSRLRHVQRIEDGAKLRVGTIELTAHATPGHTPGSTTWTWDSCEEDRACVHVVYADSLTPISDDAYRYSDQDALGDAFGRSIERVAALSCDILLTPHPDASSMWTRLGPGARDPLIDAEACHRYASNARTRLDERLAHERANDRLGQ